MGNFSHSHNGVKLEILPTLIEVCLRHLSFCRRKAFYDDGYNKIHELSNYKGNLISRFNVLCKMSTVHCIRFKKVFSEKMELSLEYKQNSEYKILVTTYLCVKTTTPRLFNYLLVVNLFIFQIRLKNTMQ